MYMQNLRLLNRYRCYHQYWFYKWLLVGWYQSPQTTTIKHAPLLKLKNIHQDHANIQGVFGAKMPYQSNCQAYLKY
jgi:hypothetical protein